MKFYPITRNYTINIPVDGGTSQVQYNDNGVTRKVYAGKEEFPGNNRTGMYHKDGDPQLSVSPAEHSWITVSLGSVDETNTAAPVMYNAQVNLGDEARSVDVTLNGNTAVTFTLRQTYTPKLMYMMKNSSEKYGDWVECMKINKGNKISSNQAPLTSTTDISIFNGRNGTVYNSIDVEIQPYRNMNVSFGFSSDNNLDSLITSKYTMQIVKDSTFIENKAYNTNTGYFSFSTNNQNSWTKKTPGGGGTGEVIDVSSHFKFNPNSGVNLPEINFYISNMISYRVIKSYNVKITCLQGGGCFINQAYVDGYESQAQNWPSTTNSYIILQNCAYGKSILLTYPEADPEQGGFTVMVNQLLNMRYSVSIEGFDYIDYDGTTKHSNGTLPINVYDDTNLFTIIKTWREGGTTEVSALINFISTASTNEQTFRKADAWPSNIPQLNQGWSIASWEPQSGIAIELTANDWRFISSSGVSKRTTIGFLSY